MWMIPRAVLVRLVTKMSRFVMKFEMLCFHKRGEKIEGYEKKIILRREHQFGFYKSRKNLGEKQNACQDWRSGGMGIFWHGP